MQTMTNGSCGTIRAPTVYAIGEAAADDALTAAGIRQSEDPAEIDIVIASYDRTFEYRKLQIAFDALWFTSVAPASSPPIPIGIARSPVAGVSRTAAAIVAAIEACTGTTLRSQCRQARPDHAAGDHGGAWTPRLRTR